MFSSHLFFFIFREASKEAALEEISIENSSFNDESSLFQPFKKE
jgi:hypothetical protein